MCCKSLLKVLRFFSFLAILIHFFPKKIKIIKALNFLPLSVINTLYKLISVNFPLLLRICWTWSILIAFLLVFDTPPFWKCHQILMKHMCIYPLLLGNFLWCWLDKFSEWFFRTGTSEKWRLMHADLPYGQDFTETLFFFLWDIHTNPRSYVHSFVFNNIVQHTVHKSM